MDFCMIYVTASNKEEAVSIGRRAVEEKLAACANVIEKMTSIYPWEGQIHQESECVLILKSRKSLLDRLTALVKSLHSYKCPCVVSFDLAKGNQDYFDWLAKNTLNQ
jgi:periplasmic divalent cation tolerance protein